jgi:pyruvate dehydrogenase E1 component beta subunit
MMAEIAAELQERAMESLDGPIVRVGAENVPWPYNRELEQESYPQSSDVMTALGKHYGI